MELKDKKFIKNTGRLPGFEEGFISPFSMMQNNLNGGSFINSDFDVQGETRQFSPYREIMSNMNRSSQKTVNAVKNTIAGPINTADDPYTQNPRLIPGEQVDPETPEKKKIDVSDAIQEGINTIGVLASIATPRSDSELSQYAKDLEGSAAGITYKKKSQILHAKDGKLPGYVLGRSVFGDALKGAGAGASVGSVAGPWGTAIGAAAGTVLGGALSWFAGDREKDTINSINRRNAAYNYGNYNGALSTAIQQANAVQYGDTRNGYLRPYKCGKLPGYSNGVRSAFGLINGMPANARTDGDELIIDTLTGAVAQNPSSKYTDSYNSYIRPQDMIIPGKQSKGLLKALGFKNGRLPGFANGRWDNFATSLASGVAGLSQYLQAMNDTPYKPNTYASNPYEKKALNDLYGLRANVYPILPSIYDAQAKGMYAIANSGGLSGGQRTLARLAATSGTQQNIANMLLNAQNQNNQYLAQAANASLTAGNNAAQRRMQANQFDLDYFSKAHAARQQGMQMGLYNMVNSLQNYYKNKNKWDMFAMSHKLYSDELEAKKKGGYFSRV